jgi:hypothetical protein
LPLRRFPQAWRRVDADRPAAPAAAERPFHLLIVDHENDRYTVEGAMTDPQAPGMWHGKIMPMSRSPGRLRMSLATLRNSLSTGLPVEFGREKRGQKQ